MHWADIHAAMIKAGHPPSNVARKLGITPQTVSLVIRGTTTSHNVASYISCVTYIPLNKLWPDGRYDKPHARSKEEAA
jgi:lambda repressor-like predicted transcriptional regulator